jgi:wyosine [tRNA(Phe)-imidazoG37] synthetase (radical SAM superfamily)
MTAKGFQYTFGPVPSRRLGKSLGINNIPFKRCTYSCIYCQAGLTTIMTLARRALYQPEEIFRDVLDRIAMTKEAAEPINYLAFVPDGEPTLDISLGNEVAMMKSLGIPVGVITNGSLLWRDDVRKALGGADWVSLKIDAVEERIWRANRSSPQKVETLLHPCGDGEICQDLRGQAGHRSDARQGHQ